VKWALRQRCPQCRPKGRVRLKSSRPWFLNVENYGANELNNCPLSAAVSFLQHVTATFTMPLQLAHTAATRRC